MAGHSKWANIQHRKGRQDAKRGKLWTKIIREVTVAARAGGADPDSNPALRLAWDKAMAANMPKDNIESAIKRAAQKDIASFTEVNYEGKGPHGVLTRRYSPVTTSRNSPGGAANRKELAI